MLTFLVMRIIIRHPPALQTSIRVMRDILDGVLMNLIGLAPDVILVHIGTNDFGMFCVHDMICPSYDVGFVYVPR